MRSLRNLAIALTLLVSLPLLASCEPTPQTVRTSTTSMTPKQAAGWYGKTLAYASAVQYAKLLDFAAAVQYQKILAFAVAVEAAKRPTYRAVWDDIAACESGGNWASTAGSFEGGVQFLRSTWLSQGGGKYAQHAYDATKYQQIEIAERLLAQSGWGQWPSCSRQLGLR